MITFNEEGYLDLYINSITRVFLRKDKDEQVFLHHQVCYSQRNCKVILPDVLRLGKYSEFNEDPDLVQSMKEKRISGEII